MGVASTGMTLAVLLSTSSLLLPAAGASTPTSSPAVTCAGRVATIVGTGQGEVLRGTAGRDVVAGLGGNDTLVGLGGDDLLCGGGGSDRLLGGPGDDRLLGGRDWRHVTDEGSTERMGDTLLGGDGDDRLVPGRDLRRADEVIRDAVSWETAARGVHVDVGRGVATGQGRDGFDGRRVAVVASDQSDVVRGSPHRDLLISGRGDDVVRGLGGADRIIVDPAGRGGGDDVANGGSGDDSISASGGEDVLRGGPGNDAIDDLGPAADRLYGGRGADLLFTQVSDVPGAEQVVDGGPGSRDFVDLHTQTINPATQASTAEWSMRTGRLVFTLDHPVALTVVHLERVDLSAFGTAWTITGTPGPDSVSAAGSAGTVFLGRGGDDTFLGSAFDDTFGGGAGQDRSLGMGVGNDTCSSVETLDVADCETVVP